MESYKDCSGGEFEFLPGKKACLKTNRHYTSNGSAWGWIEPVVRECGRDCAYWDNDTEQNEIWAKTLIKRHNETIIS